ncbi:glycerophosphodiester phosphodiesterase [Streptomyces catenulae]|uniref:Glycerophosphodiester phosphodiesterase family protein n=1 Tax=Streptomyces catenulae TaxID=66875 RepID=A0ABV2Z3R0_9ACTN|nr:glycerophosphodiester phosphodiesterase family protein [Streptomyces catenulae]
MPHIPRRRAAAVTLLAALATVTALTAPAARTGPRPAVAPAAHPRGLPDGLRPPTAPAVAAPLVIAHRGAARQAPENTLAAVDAAHRSGLTWVENDVQRTKDGQLVVVHDATLRRTTDAAHTLPGRAPWRVADLTAAEIARLDAGSWFATRFAGERIPTLTRYLRRLDDHHQSLLLELKNPARYPGIEAQALRLLRAEGWLDRVHHGRLVVQSFDARAVRTVHRLAPRLRTAVLGAPALRDATRYARFTDGINPPLDHLTPRWAAAVHRLHGPHGDPLRIYGWGPGATPDARAAAARGIDGVVA